MSEVLFLTFGLCLLLSMPVVFSLLVASITAILWGGSVPLTIVAHKLVSGIDSYPLLAIPLFIVFGEVVNKGGIGRRIVDFSQALVGSFRGGLAHATSIVGMHIVWCAC